MAIPLGVFELGAPLARGGMAEVWAGVHAPTGVPVAVKVLTSDHARESRLAEALQREIRAVAGLDHPHVIWVHDHGVVDARAVRASKGRLQFGSPWVAMELADGGALGDRWELPTWAELRQILLQLLDALAHAHARGIIHRDVKPANVLFKVEVGRPPVLKLSDFGIVHVLEEASGATGVTGGTPRFMAPEQFTSAGLDLGPWTDLYAVGLLAYRLCTGSHVFGGRTLAELMKAHRSTPVPRLEPVIAVPDGFEAWVRRLLAKPIEERYQRAADAAWGLASLAAVSGLVAPSISAPVDGDDTPTRIRSSQPTALVLPDLAQSRQVVSELQVGSTTAEVPRPALPPDWRNLADAGRSAALMGVGLGMFGLRELPLVGRHTEQARLWGQLAKVEATGRARLVVVRGAAGMGKSRLVRWLVRRAHEVGAVEVFRATHDETGGAMDGLPGLLARTWRTIGMDRASAAGRLAVLLRLPADDAAVESLLDAADPGRASLLRPVARHLQVARTLALHARGRVPLVWLDDVQWGPDAVALAETLLRGHLADVAPLLVLTVRDEAASPTLEASLARLEGRDDAVRIDLEPLGRQHRSDLLRTSLLLEPRLAATVDERTEGHPLFAVQLVSDWISRGVLTAGPGGFGLAPGQSEEAPPSLSRVWTRRLEQVLAGHDSDWPALELAAVLGRRIDRLEWQEACAHAGLDAAVERLPDLERAGLTEVGAGGFVWVHGMLRESLREHARQAGRLVAHHRAICTMLEAREGSPERLGRHLLGAERFEDAYPVLSRAAGSATSYAEYSRELFLLGLAEQALEALEPVGRRGGTSPASGEARSDPRFARVWFRMAMALSVMGRRADAEALLRRGQRLAERLEDRLLLSRLQELRATFAIQTGRPADARDHSAEAVRLAEASGDRVAVTRALMVQGTSLRQVGDSDGAQVAFLRAIELCDPIEQRGTVAICRFGLVYLYMHRGQLDDARRAALAGQASATAHGRPMLAMDFCRALGDIAFDLEDLDEAEARYQEAHEAYVAAASPFRTISSDCLGQIALWRGDLPRAELLVRAAMAAALQCGRSGWLEGSRYLLLAVLAEQGRWSEVDTTLGVIAESIADIEASRGKLNLLERAAGVAERSDEPARALEIRAVAKRGWDRLPPDPRGAGPG